MPVMCPASGQFHPRSDGHHKDFGWWDLCEWKTFWLIPATPDIFITKEERKTFPKGLFILQSVRLSEIIFSTMFQKQLAKRLWDLSGIIILTSVSELEISGTNLIFCIKMSFYCMYMKIWPFPNPTWATSICCPRWDTFLLSGHMTKWQLSELLAFVGFFPTHMRITIIHHHPGSARQHSSDSLAIWWSSKTGRDWKGPMFEFPKNI